MATPWHVCPPAPRYSGLPSRTRTPAVGSFLPGVISQLMLDPLLSILTCHDQRGEAASWDAIDVYDPAWGGGVDMEGTPRQPTLFMSSGEIVTPPVGGVHHRRNATAATGDAGLTAPMIRGLVVAGHNVTSRPLPTAERIVVSAARLTSGASTRSAVVGLRFGNPEEKDDGTRVLHLPNLCRLLQEGLWCGPWQRGIGEWTSQRLAIGDPETWLRHQRT